MYQYRCEITKIVDGDTVHARVDLGLDVRIDTTLRLAEIDAPEIATDAGRAAKEWLERRLDQVRLPSGNPVVTIETIKDRRERYGRYLARLYTPHGATSINDEMVAVGHAVAYDGGRRG